MNVIALHKTSFAVINIISVDSVTKTGDNIVVHGIATTVPGVVNNFTFPTADYLVSIVAN